VLWFIGSRRGGGDEKKKQHRDAQSGVESLSQDIKIEDRTKDQNHYTTDTLKVMGT
jgi:hypothetical protein